MRRGVGDIEKERSVLAAVLVEEGNGVVGDSVGHVEAFGGGHIWIVIHGHLAPRIQSEVAARAADQAEVVLEAAVEGPVGPVFADVPLAGHQDVVAALA